MDVSSSFFEKPYPYSITLNVRVYFLYLYSELAEILVLWEKEKKIDFP